MEYLLRKLAACVRGCLRALTTQRSEVSPLSKLLRGIVLVPLFGMLYASLRVWVLVKGPLEVEATTYYGCTFRCRMPDMIQTYLYLFEIWEPDLSAFIDDRLQSGGTFVDVGANIGYHTLLAAKRLAGQVGGAGQGGGVAIESSPKVFALLEHSLESNNLQQNVRTVNKAASETVGVLPLFEGPDQNIGLSTTVQTRGLPSEGEIPAAPLGDLLKADEIASARLVKIDVEGAEGAVLAGMNSFLDQCPQEVELLVELSPEWWEDQTLTPQAVLQPFLDRGFHVYEIENNLWPWRYLWPQDVSRPRRLKQSLTERVQRLDLVLSRTDAEQL